MGSPVRILGTGSSLPGPPIPTERVEEVLGPIVGLKPRVAERAERLGAEMRERSGIRTRHFALDPATRRQTETNASLAEKAVRAALERAQAAPDSVDLLVGTFPLPDCLCPSTTSLLQGRLGVESMHEIEIHSNCSGTPKALQVALDMLRTGRHRRAVVVAAQTPSLLLRAEFYRPETTKLEHLVLRWMMSDGAGALVLDAAADPADGPVLLEAHLDVRGGLRPPGMTGLPLGSFACDTPLEGRSVLEALFASGLHTLSQDLAAVGRDAPRHFAEGLATMVEDAGLTGPEVAHYLLAVPGLHFVVGEPLEILAQRLGDAVSRAARDLLDFGYCGAATPLIQLDRLARGGAWARGALVAAYVEESASWTSGGFLARG